jgi:hypothetical protein
MLFDPVEAEEKIQAAKAREEENKVKELVTPDGELLQHRHRRFKGNLKLFERWVRFKQFVLLKSYRRRVAGKDDNGRKKSLLGLFFW